MANESRHPGLDRTALAGDDRQRWRAAGRLAPPPVSADHELRRRLTAAWAESIAVRGYSRTTVQHLVDSSRISRSTFYDNFGSKDEAFVAIHTDALASLGMHVTVAAAAEPTWPRKVTSGLAAALEVAAGRPQEARLLVGDLFGAGPRMGYCHDLLLARFTPGLAAGRRSNRAPPLPSSLETALLGSLIGIVSSRVHSGVGDTLPALAPSMTEFILAPYLGVEKAKRTAGVLSAEAP